MRRQIVDIMQPLTDEQILRIPDGLGNNILWNAGHVLVTQQLLCYGLTGQDMHIPDELVSMFRKGSSPKEWAAQPSPEFIVENLIETAAKLADDYKSGKFEKKFREYETSVGITLKTIDDGLKFNSLHESIHLGIIRTIRNLIV
ncbi:MAG: DinB family protein [Candidatus Zixiibacteriota bacterium]